MAAKPVTKIVWSYDSDPATRQIAEQIKGQFQRTPRVLASRGSVRRVALPINEGAMSVELVHEFLKEICVRSGVIACSVCAAQVTVDQVSPRWGRDPVQQRAVHQLAPRAAVAQGDAVWLSLEGLR
jgi:hypothetical protein